LKGGRVRSSEKATSKKGGEGGRKGAKKSLRNFEKAAGGGVRKCGQKVLIFCVKKGKGGTQTEMLERRNVIGRKERPTERISTNCFSKGERKGPDRDKKPRCAEGGGTRGWTQRRGGKEKR